MFFNSRRYSRFINRFATPIVLVSTVLTLVSAYYSALLYKNLKTDIEELLPTHARSGQDLQKLTHRMDSFDYIAVLAFSDDTKASKRFVDDLAKELATSLPKGLAGSIEYKIGDEIQFFRSRLGLYLEMDDLKKVHNYVRDRIAYEKEMYSPLNIFPVSDTLKKPELDFESLQKKYQGNNSSITAYPDGYYATPDEKKRVLLVYLEGKHSDIHRAHELNAGITKAVEKLNPKSYAPDLEVKYTGGVQSFLEEHGALIADLELSTAIVVLLVTLSMVIFYQDIAATTCLVISLFMGTFWTFAISYFVVGYLNANSAFLGSIVIGNGINFGVILLARYLEERRKGTGTSLSLHSSMFATLPATSTAALAAGLSYGSLMLTRFRGFRQFGVIGFIGMMLCWISAYLVLPAMLKLIERRRPRRRREKLRASAARVERSVGSAIPQAVANLVDKRWKSISIATVVLTCLAVMTFPKINRQLIQTDLSKLRNKESIEHGAGFYDKFLVEIFQRYLTPTVILTDTRDEAVKIAERLRALKKEQGDKSDLGSIQTLQDFVPTNQPEKIALLKETKALLTPKIVKNLPKQEQDWIKDFLADNAFREFEEKDLPDLVLRKFTEVDGQRGRMVVVNPPLEKNDDIAWNGARLIHFIDELRSEVDQIKPGTPVSGQLPISADLVKSISEDGPKATIFALLSVIILVAVLFRHAETIGLALSALFFGVIWLAGIVLGLGLKINFLNFIALPITFGIGVDYGVNVFQRYREERKNNRSARRILTVIRQTGGAVMLASVTTIIGYGSLLIAGNQAFVSFGTLAVLGEITCIVAAVVSLPALLVYIDSRKRNETGASVVNDERVSST